MSHGHSVDSDRRRLRQEVRLVPCTFCGAQAGEKCLGHTYKDGSRYVRASSHAERWTLYREWVKSKTAPRH